MGFLGELEKIFNTDVSSIYILPTARPYIRNSKKLRTKYSEQTLMNILTIINQYKTIPDEFIDDKFYQSLVKIEKIDSGERVLFSVNPVINEFLVLTGDKNSVIQLGNQTNIDEIKNNLKGKVVCLEYIVLKLLELNEIGSFSKNIIESGFGGDKTLEIIFNQPNLNFEKAKDGLISYYNDLYTQSGQLLLPL